MAKVRILKINPNVKKSKQIKFECHKLINEIWGFSSSDRSKGYKWLKDEFGFDVHFSSVNDNELLHSIWERLWQYSFKHSSHK